MSRHAPILGKLGAEWQGGPFRMFDTGRVHGLAIREGDTLHLLAVVAYDEGQGHAGQLLQDCQRAYAEVTVWEVGNPRMRQMLERRGFRRSLRPAESPTFPDYIVYTWRQDGTHGVASPVA